MAANTNPKPTKRPARWVWPLLAAPYIGLLFPGMYNRATPALLDFPFFYWYQLGWVVVTSALLYVVYLQFKSE